jgi:hypothetical protein
VPYVICVYNNSITAIGEVITPYPINVGVYDQFFVNCTVNTSQTVIFEGLDLFLMNCSAPGNFYACSEVVQPLDLNSTLVDRATTCSHDHTHSGTPNDGAGKVTAWVLIGVVPIVIIIIVAVVLTRQRPGRKGRGTRASDEELETLTGRRG